MPRRGRCFLDGLHGRSHSFALISLFPHSPFAIHSWSSTTKSTALTYFKQYTSSRSYNAYIATYNNSHVIVYLTTILNCSGTDAASLPDENTTRHALQYLFTFNV